MLVLCTGLVACPGQNPAASATPPEVTPLPATTATAEVLGGLEDPGQVATASGPTNAPRGTPALKIATFNIRVLTTRSRTDRELEVIAQLLAPWDLVQIQEVRDLEVLDRLVRILDSRFNLRFQWKASPPLGRGVKEIYVWMYQPRVLEPFPAGVLVYPDPGDHFIREPSVLAFKTLEGFDFLAAQVHLVFGVSVKERKTEAALLDEVMAWALGTADPGESEAYLCGDFNLSPLDDAFSGLEGAGFSSIKGAEGTTITGSPFDTFWVSHDMKHGYAGVWGMERFDENLYDDDDKKASLEVSDHRPIWMEITLPVRP